MKKKHYLILIILIGTTCLNFAGCASVISREIRKELDLKLTLEEVRSKPDYYKGAKVLWGGIIVSSKNEAEKTVIEVVQAPLGSMDKPENPDRSKGRFIMEFAGFLDTALYAAGREITVAGEIIGSMQGTIGEMEYTFPVLKSIKIHLWEIKEIPEYIPSPFFCDPFYYPYCWPYHPYRRYPYW